MSSPTKREGLGEKGRGKRNVYDGGVGISVALSENVLTNVRYETFTGYVRETDKGHICTTTQTPITTC